jgi:granule-bound starch synthase
VQVWGKTGSKLYGAKSGADYVDNPKRFRVFSEACIEAVRALPFGPGEDCVFVANDWHTAMVPVLLKVRRGLVAVSVSWSLTSRKISSPIA